MKQLKKLGAIVLALCMCMSLCVTAFAATTNSSEDGKFTITISNAYIGSTYNAYKIFDVTYDENGNYSYTIDSGSAWYSTVAAATDVFTLTQASGSSTYVVTVNEGVEDSAVIAVFINAGVPSGAEAVATVAEYTGTPDPLVLDVTTSGPGYYFVTTTTGSVVSITTTDPNANIIDKNGSWDLDKVVVGGLDEDNNLHEDAEAMGDDVTFKVTANVPLYTNEEPDNVKETYTQGDVIAASPEGYLVTDYKFADSMSAGLEIRGLALGIDYTYDEDTQTYWATASLIDTWVTINDEPISTCAYNIKMQLIPDTNDSGELVRDENGQIQFCGFVLTYDTLPYGYYALVSGAYVLSDEDNGTWGLPYDSNGDGTKDSLLTVSSEVTFETAADLVAAVGTNYPANASIEIDYTAHVTDEAVYDNTNDITMTWDGTSYRNPKPLEPEYTGDEDKEDNIYVLDIEILKVDGSSYDQGTESYTSVLAGAEFKLEGKNLKDVVTSQSVSYTPIESWEEYQEALDGGAVLYFLLKSGEHTTVSPYELAEADPSDPDLENYVVNPYWGINATTGEQTGETGDDLYKVGDYKYVAYTKTVTDDYGLEESGDDHYVTGTTDANGHLSFTGLTVGDWTLTEIVAPDGYNLLEDPIEFTISVTWETDGTPTWTISGTGSSTDVTFTMVDEDGEKSSETTGRWMITIENNAGTLLPGTGGIGTTIFYIVGAILVCGAVVVLVTRRRVNRA